MHIHDIDTPALLIDIDRLESNIRSLASYHDEHGLHLTPHIKTHKSVEIARRQMESGAVGVACAKLGEAEQMARHGISELLLAYPIVGEVKLSRLTALGKTARVTVAIDSVEVAEGIASAAERDGVTIGVMAEVNTGTNRCGLPPGNDLLALTRAMIDRNGLEFRGLMLYQGHITGLRRERREEMVREIDRVADTLDLFQRERIDLPIVSAASSPNRFEMHHLPGITHVRHGTYVFHDRNTMAQEACEPDDCALSVAVTVVSTAVAGQIVIDAGSKTLSSDRLAGGGEGHGYCVEDPSLVLEKMNEEHGYVNRSRSDRSYRVGDRLHFIPNHVCTCVNLHEEMAVHRGGDVVDIWRVDARGMVR